MNDRMNELDFGAWNEQMNFGIWDESDESDQANM